MSGVHLKLVRNTRADQIQMNAVNCELVEFFKLFIVKYILWKIVLSLTPQWRSKYANFCFFGDKYVFYNIGQNEAYFFLGSYCDAKMSILQHIFHYNTKDIIIVEGKMRLKTIINNLVHVQGKIAIESARQN